ncbi:heme-degrading domain-containing protein [Paenibacillus fonticola]|uniref:heme-degrading domain-containing protein n=1 Tax=Paenibacillus fonticola TaxID=379896 RepID=UPI0003695F34|nr:heme-degrading domain-containing protein [Paenibacillus fonticola]
MLKNDQLLLDILLQDEEDLQFSQFTHNTAVLIGTKIVEKALKDNSPMVISIQKNGQQLFYSKLDGATMDNDLWIKRKNKVVEHFNHSSYYMNVLFKTTQTTIESYFLDRKDFGVEPGAFPIIVRDVGIIGTITVSGVPGEGEDHKIITSVLKEMLQ